MSKVAGWSTIGGHLVLDLVNTVTWRDDPSRRADRLEDITALRTWAAAMGVCVAETTTGRESQDALIRVRQLRELVGDALDRRTQGQGSNAHALTELRRRYEQACASAELAPELPLRWHVSPTTLPRLATFLELQAGDFLRWPDLNLVRRCEAPGCGWLFLDTTRNHSRRWCDSGDCGNRIRVRRHASKASSAS